MSEFAGRVVLVTGASGNLGAAVCKRLLAGGARVVAGVHRPEGAEGLRAAPGADERLSVVSVDLRDDAAAEATVASAEARAGPLFAAVHTVGGWAGGATVAESSLAVLDRMLDANLRTAFTLARAAMRGFSARREGRFVAVAAYGPASGVGQSGSAAYAASKAGLIALVRALAEEGAPLGIRCSCVAPNTMRTPQNAAAMPAADQSGWVALAEVAEAIAFLCAPAQSGVNGSVLLLPGL